MKYTTEKGEELSSKPNEIVEFTEESNYPDGIYESTETCGAVNEFGIKQIQIRREVENGICKYIIKESTNQELKDYLDKVKLENNLANAE